MRKFAFELNRNGKDYNNELRQAVANKVDYYLTTTSSSAWDIWHIVAEDFGISWGSARKYHNALGNAPSARGRKKNAPNIKPIAEKQYPEALRKLIMQNALRNGLSVPKVAKLAGVSNSTVYDWIKAYGWSTAYFNR